MKTRGKENSLLYISYPRQIGKEVNGMSEHIKMQRCNPCQVAVMPSEHGTTRFPCPSCGMIPIIRCERCRKLGNRYACPNCGFNGP